ncbi:hypothetical protein CsSME_00008533 [Camellia sinensis var. sinensis]
MTTTIEIKDALRTFLFLFLLSFFLSKYSSEGKVSTKGDTYNYGITLLETFTRKKPTDEMFSEAQSLKQWLNASLPDRVMEVVDGGLLRTEDGRDVFVNKDYLLAIMEISNCSFFAVDKLELCLVVMCNSEIAFV